LEGSLGLDGNIKKLAQLLTGILPARHGMALRLLAVVNLVVVATLKGLVAKKEDALEVGVVLDVAKAVRLVPALGEDVKANLCSRPQT